MGEGAGGAEGGGGKARDLPRPVAQPPIDQQRPQRPFSIYKLLIFRKPNCECLGLGPEQAATLAERQAEAAKEKVSQGGKSYNIKKI